MRGAVPLSLLFLGALFGGCLGGGSDSNAPSTLTDEPTPPPAGLARVSATEGAIDVLVTDGAFNPLVAARVTMLEPASPTGVQPSALTDAEGRAVFSDLPPGLYKLVAEKIGYDSVGIAREVAAGQVSKFVFNLPSLAVDDAPYVVPLEFRGFIACGATVVVLATAPCADDPNHNAEYEWNVSAAIATVVVAVKWRATGGGFGEYLRVIVETACQDLGPDCPAYAVSEERSPLVITLDKANLSAVQAIPENGTVGVRLRVFTGSSPETATGYAYQQPFAAYIHLFYRDPAPANFTGLPDE